MISAPEFEKKQILFMFTRYGDKLSYSNDNVVIKNREGKIKHQSTCYRLFLLCIVGNVSITSGLLQRAKKFGFSIVLMTQTMRVYQVIGCAADGNTLLRKKQYGYDSIELGQHIIRNKVMCQRTALSGIREKSSAQKDAIRILDQHLESLRDADPTVASVMGVEGSAARTYFSQIFDDMQWKCRRPRIKSDYLNSALDIGYSILFNLVEAILSAFGFDLYYGVFHRCFYMRKSLVCDVMEPMRPIIDLQLRKSVHLKQFQESDFEVFNHRYVLKWEHNAKYVSVFTQALLDHKSDIFTYIQQYYRAFMKEKKPEDFPVFQLW